jgi:rubrerythrin
MNLKKRRYNTLRIGRSTDENQDDGDQYRCRVCGFICDRKRTEISTSEHSEYTDGNTYTTDADGDYIVSADRGCPFCGTLFSRLG